MAIGKKTGGRQKGTPNKSTQTLLQKCEALGIDVFQAMLELAKEATDPDKKFAMLRDIAPYIQPKRSHIAHDIDPKTVEAVEQVNELSKEEQILLLESEVKRLKGES